MLAAVAMMGFTISWLVPCGFGTDGCTALNLAISKKLGMSFGNWSALINCVMFLAMLVWGRQLIGIGMLANMLLVGYICDFFSWVWRMVLPAGFFDPLGVRIAVAIPTLILFVLAAALYMDMDLGMAPYDALPFIVHNRLCKKLPFRVIRISWDLIVILLGYAFGAPFAAVTLAMAFLLGPAVEIVRKKLHTQKAL